MLFRVAPGGGSGSYGVRSGEVAGLPPELLRNAAARAQALEERAEKRRADSQQCRLAAKVARAIAAGTAGAVLLELQTETSRAREVMIS